MCSASLIETFSSFQKLTDENKDSVSQNETSLKKEHNLIRQENTIFKLLIKLSFSSIEQDITTETNMKIIYITLFVLI